MFQFGLGAAREPPAGRRGDADVFLGASVVIVTSSAAWRLADVFRWCDWSAVRFDIEDLENRFLAGAGPCASTVNSS